MPNSNLNAEMRSRIDRFLDELAALVKNAALESVQAALGGAASAKRGRGRPRSTPAPSGAPRGRPAKSSRGKRSSAEVDQTAGRIQTFVRSNPGLGLEAIAKGIGTTTKELKLPIIKLLASRALSKKGQKRGTKYFASGRGGGAAKPKAKRAKKRGRKRAASAKSAKRAKRAKRAGRKAALAAAA
jgi:hypothetical protein